MKPEIDDTNKTGMPKLLTTVLRRDGFDYKQVWRDGNYAIYSQTKRGTQIQAYECIRIKTANPVTLKGIAYPLREVYPPSESWGTDAFTAKTLEKAHEYVARLTHAVC